MRFIFSSDLDQSFDDDCDGKLVIAEHDEDDLKAEELDGAKDKKPRRKHNRFNGLAEEEVMKRHLPDLICPNLDILIVSIIIPQWNVWELERAWRNNVLCCAFIYGLNILLYSLFFPGG